MQKQELLNQVRNYFIDNIPFNKLVGIEIMDINAEEARLRMNMRPDLIGNGLIGILHGGVTATMLDVAGGLAAIAQSIEKLNSLDADSLVRKLKTLGTIDMRVDYLAPGRGEYFEAVARVVRHGRKVCVTRMEVHNDKGTQIALGTATYIVG